MNELPGDPLVRHEERDRILLALGGWTDQAHRHFIVSGPPGSGKTRLVGAVAAAMAHRADDHGGWLPLVFGEEAYHLISPGLFWFEAVLHTDADPKSIAVLRALEDDSELQLQCLAWLERHSEALGRPLLLVVEHLDHLLGHQLNGDERETLLKQMTQTTCLGVLGTAANAPNWAAVEAGGGDLFQHMALEPLNTEACKQLWRQAAGGEEPVLLRPIQILTGGNPRLLGLFARTAWAGDDFLEHLNQVIERHALYLKSRIEGVSVQERAVLSAVLTLWDPVSSRDVAKTARLDVNKTSALLSRLTERGLVAVYDRGQNRKYYQAAERLYSVFLLLRRGGTGGARVAAMCEFMSHFYRRGRSGRRASRVESRFEAVFEVLHRPPETLSRDIDLGRTTRDFFHTPPLPEILLREPRVDAVADQWALSREHFENSQWDASLAALERMIEAGANDATPWLLIGLLHLKMARPAEAAHALERSLVLDPDIDWTWEALGHLARSEGRYEDAETVYHTAIAKNPDNERAWLHLGLLLHDHLDRRHEAEFAYRTALERRPDDDRIWVCLGVLLHVHLNRPDEAETAYRTAVARQPENHTAWARLGLLLHLDLHRLEEAQDAYARAVRLEPATLEYLPLVPLYAEMRLDPRERLQTLLSETQAGAGGLNHLATQLYELGDERLMDEAERLSRAALALADHWVWRHTLAAVLSAQEKYEEAALLTLTTLEADVSDTESFEAVLDPFLTLAARGYAAYLAEGVAASSHYGAWEPLAAGLRLYLGQDPKPRVAYEIAMIGEDLAADIRERERS